MKLIEIAKAIANNAGMPYVWEDVLNRLKVGEPLPFKLLNYKEPPNKVDSVCANCFACLYAKNAGHNYCYNCGKKVKQDCSQNISYKKGFT